MINTISPEDTKWYALGLYFGYYFLFEFTIGRTIAKFFTKTKVISLDKTKPGFLQILLRSFMRVILLDPLSYLFGVRGLHDRISKTTLIKLE